MAFFRKANFGMKLDNLLVLQLRNQLLEPN